LELAGTAPSSLRTTRLLRFDADAVARVELGYGDGSRIRLERSEAPGGSDAPTAPIWSAIVGETHASVSAHRIAALLWSVSQLRAQGPRDPVTDPLAPPA